MGFPTKNDQHLGCVLGENPPSQVPRRFKEAEEDKRLRTVSWSKIKIGVPQNGWFIMDNPIKMDDLGVPLFLETPNW